MPPLYPESRYTVVVEGTGVTCRHPSGKEESVTWASLDAVVIETNDSGPWGTDVLWLLVSHSGPGGCVIPQGATGEEALLAALQKLPGFDNGQVIAAMSSTDNHAFVCWRRVNP